MEDRNSEYFNGKRKFRISVVAGVGYLLLLFITGLCLKESSYGICYEEKFLPPSIHHLFGTDNMGRDMFFRCLKGMSTSMVIGILAAAVSSVVALVLGIVSGVWEGIVDKVINWAIDLCMGLPHIVLLLLISFMMGKGVKGVTIAVALTHWPALTRLVRSEVLQLRSSLYVQVAYRMGKSKLQVAVSHMLPHVLPTYLIGLLLLFPHAIMHEAAITFLGFGLPSEMPAIGVILSESMDYIAAGKWWMALFPGLLLLSVVLLFDLVGEQLKKRYSPGSSNE